MEENKTPDKIEPTQNLDTNSRVIQPPISGDGINTTQIEPPKRQISQPQPTVAAQVQPQQIKTPPTYAGPQPKNPVVSYVPGGIYVIAAVMIAPMLRVIYSAVSVFAVTRSFDPKTVLELIKLSFSSQLILACAAIAIAGTVGGIMLFKRRRLGLTIAIILALVLLIYGLVFTIKMIGIAGSSVNFYGIAEIYLFESISLGILLPIFVISYLMQQKVRDFVSF